MINNENIFLIQIYDEFDLKLFKKLILIFLIKFQKLRSHYLPIEHDPNMSDEEKLPHMIEWWKKTLDLLVLTKINKDSISEVVRNSFTHLRDGCKWFFYTLERHEIPLLIFSAGLGDIIQEWIFQECGSFKNMKIISNFMKFDPQTNKVVGYKSQIIHLYNKNETVLTNTDYLKTINNRSNAIVIGDSLSDANMTAGFSSLNNVLKIGFLNNKIDEFLPIYMNSFDIVILKDDTFNIPNAILRSIL